MKAKTRGVLMILGAGVMQGPAIILAREMGLETVAVDADPKAPSVPLADHFECIDLKDKEGIEEFGRRLLKEGGLSGIMTAGTDFSASAAWAAERLGLPGIPYEAALNASDKERMRRCFKAASLPSPEFVIIQKDDSLKEGASLPFPFPVVVKPVDNMGSRGCRRVDDAETLKAAAAEAMSFSRSGRVIVEEYMEGPEFSVDALIYRREIIICGLADRHIFFPPYFIEMGHTMPTALPPKEAESLLAVFCRGVRALGLAEASSVGAAKGDIKLTPKGPMIGEIAARLSGGYMSGWTFPYASGVEVTRGAILLALGKPPGDLKPLRDWTCTERAFISIPGKVRAIRGIREAEAMPYVKNLFLRAGPGSRVRFPENNVSKCGNILAAAPDRETAAAAAEAAARQVLLRLEAPDEVTARFLEVEEDGGFWPPNAFSVDKALYAALEKLPETALPAGTEGLAIHPFPEFQLSGCRDYMGRTVEESLQAVRELTGLALPVSEVLTGPALGRSFWAALIRGGYQGAVYLIDFL